MKEALSHLSTSELVLWFVIVGHLALVASMALTMHLYRVRRKRQSRRPRRTWAFLEA